MKWRLSYCKSILRRIKKYKKEKLNLFNELASEFEGCKGNFSEKIDYLISYFIFGAQPEDYIIGNFYRIKNFFYRNHYVTIDRLNFIKCKFNTYEGLFFLDSKEKFDLFYNEYMGRKWCNPSKISEEEFIRTFYLQNGYVFVKPMNGYGGIGNFKHSADKKSLENLYKRLTESDENFIVESYIEQKGVLHDINPSSLNTIRIATVRVRKRVVPLFAYFRAGGAGSIVDNLHSGGVSYSIDIKNGKILPGITFKKDNIVSHPSTGIKVAGRIVPHWEAILEYAGKLHKMAPEGIGLVGWDICLNGDELCVIEGNGGPAFPREIRFRDNRWKNVKRLLSEF